MDWFSTLNTKLQSVFFRTNTTRTTPKNKAENSSRWVSVMASTTARQTTIRVAADGTGSQLWDSALLPSYSRPRPRHHKSLCFFRKKYFLFKKIFLKKKIFNSNLT